MNLFRIFFFIASCFGLPPGHLFGDAIPYDASLASPVVGLENGSGQPSNASANSTTLPPGNYDYAVTAVYANGTEGASTDAGVQVVDGNRRAPILIVHNGVSQNAGAIVAYNIYRSFNGGLHYFVCSVTASPSYVTYQFQCDTTAAAHGNTLEPGEAAANAIPATGYVATVKDRVYQGDGCVITITPVTTASNPANFPAHFTSAVSMTATSSDGQTVTTAVPRVGGQVVVPMLQSGAKTVVISSAGKFTDTGSAVPVTVLAGLRQTSDTGHISIAPNPFPTNLAYQTSSTTPALELINTLQGRRALMFAQGEPVGFLIPYQDSFRQQTRVRADSYEVRDFEGNLVERGAIDLNVSSAAHSARLTLTSTLPPGNYRLGIYDSARKNAGQVDSMGWWSFVVFANSQSNIPLLGVGGRAQIPALGYICCEQVPGAAAAAISSSGSIDGYASKGNGLNFVRRTFIFTPASNVTATLSIPQPGRVLVNGVTDVPINQQWFGDDYYAPFSRTFQAGQSYTIVVETFSAQGAAVSNLTATVGGTAADIFSGHIGTVSIADYPANYCPDTTGDHNDVTYRTTLGAAGSLMRFELTASTAPAEILGTLLNEQALNIGQRDVARERRRVVLTLASLSPSATRTGNFTPSGFTSFLRALIAGGVDPANLAIEYTNEPNIPPFSYTSPQSYTKDVFEPFAAATRAASASIRIIGPGCTSILGASGIDWADAFLTQLGADNALGYLDGFSFHCYNDVEGNFNNGQYALDTLKGVLTSHGLSNLPLWQTEQGYPDSYNGTATPRFGPRCLGTQLVLFDQYNLPCERSFYWYPAGEYVGAPYLNMTTIKGVCVYPNALLLRTWSDELSGKAYVSKYNCPAPWNKIIYGNLYAGRSGSEAVLMTDGETSLDVPVSVTGMSSGSLTVVRWDGRTSTVPVNNGYATINICDLPTFVRLPAGAVLTTNVRNAGVNFAASATLSSPYQIDNAGLLNDGVSTGSQRVADFGGVPQIRQSTASTDVPLDVNFGIRRSFNMVVLSCAMPFQNDGSLLDFDLQKWDDAQQAWVTFLSNTEEVRAYPQYGVCEPITLIDYSKGRHQFVLQFANQMTSKLRLLIHNVTYGGCPTDATQAYTTSATTPIPAIREFAVYNLIRLPLAPTMQVPTVIGIPD